jgi:hypothetical protein
MQKSNARLKELIKGSSSVARSDKGGKSSGARRNSSRAVAASKTKAIKAASAAAAANAASKKKVPAAERCIKQLQNLMQDLEGLAVTERQLIDSGLGKVVTKITKLSAGKKSGPRVVDAVAVAVAQGKALKRDWMQQLQGLSANGSRGAKSKASTPKGKGKGGRTKAKAKSPRALSISPGKTPKSSPAVTAVDPAGNDVEMTALHTEVEGDADTAALVVPDKLEALKRVRVRLGPIKSCDVSYVRYDATTYLVTEKAYYRIAGPRVVGSPSKAYFDTFAPSWTKFEVLHRTAELLVSTMATGNRDLTLEQACLNVVESAAKSPIKKLWLAEGMTQDAESITVTRRLYLDSYALILSEMTRLDKNAGAMMESLSYLRSSFGVELQAIGIRDAKDRGTLAKRKKGDGSGAKAKQRRRQNGNSKQSTSFSAVTVEDLTLVPLVTRRTGVAKRIKVDETDVAKRRKDQFFRPRGNKDETAECSAPEVGLESSLSVRPAPRAIFFDPALVDTHALLRRIHGGSGSGSVSPSRGAPDGGTSTNKKRAMTTENTIQNTDEDFAISNSMVGQAQVTNAAVSAVAAADQGAMFATMLTLYHGILSLLPLLEVDEEDIGSFRDFRRRYVLGELDFVHAELFRVIASRENSGVEENPSRYVTGVNLNCISWLVVRACVYNMVCIYTLVCHDTTMRVCYKLWFQSRYIQYTYT